MNLDQELELLNQNKTPYGITFNEKYHTRDGVFMELYVPMNTKQESVNKAKSWLRNQRDVIGFRVKRI